MANVFKNSTELDEFKNKVKALVILRRSKRSTTCRQRDNFGFNSYNMLTFGILTFNIVAALINTANNNNLNNNNNNNNQNMLGSQSTSNSVSPIITFDRELIIYFVPMPCRLQIAGYKGGLQFNVVFDSNCATCWTSDGRTHRITYKNTSVMDRWSAACLNLLSPETK